MQITVLDEVFGVQQRELVCGLPWFTTHSDIQLFSKMQLCSVYAIGPLQGRPLKVGYAARPDVRFAQLQTDNWVDLKVHEVAWTQGLPVAKALEKEMHRILKKAGRHIRGEWFDVPVEMIVPTFDVAIRNLKAPTLTHRGMMEKFEAEKRRVLHLQVDKLNIELLPAPTKH